MKAIHVTKKFMDSVEFGILNNLDLRSDIENNNIYDTKLIPQGYVGVGTWAIDCFTSDGMEVCSYLYTSELEYNEDVEILTLH